MCRMNKKGSFTVFVMVFMTALISMSLVFLRVSKNAAAAGAVRGLGSLWADSILAEYDKNLYERYGIFAYGGIEREVRQKLAFYAGESCADKRYVRIEELRPGLYDHSLGDKERFSEQIRDAAKEVLAGKIVGKERGEEPFRTYGSPQPVERDAGKLREGLPSSGNAGSIGAAGLAAKLLGADSFGALLERTGRTYLENEYLFSYFKDRSGGRGLGETFLENEIEYVIAGGGSDAESEGRIRRKIIAVREIVNTAFVLEDPKMRAETLAAAELMTPGAAVLTQKLLQAGWALAESVNDYRLLINGKKVPMRKDSASWALDLESLVKGGVREHGEDDPVEMKEEVPCVDPGNEHGETYRDYLRVMADLMDQDLKLLRMMDVVQMNMRKLYYADFRMRGYNTGITLAVRVNGRDLTIERTYH